MRLFVTTLALASVLAAQPKPPVRVTAILDGGTNAYYAGNRAPLLPSPLMKLPAGSVRAQGWLGHQLELMSEGFTGRLTEISSFCKFDNNAWSHPKGEGPNGWEELPYWLKGFYNLGVQLKDERIRKEAQRWLDAVLASQRPDGWFGGRGNLEGGRAPGAPSDAWPGMLAGMVPDLWPNMVMLYASSASPPSRACRAHSTASDSRPPQRMKYFVLSFKISEGRIFRWQTMTRCPHQFACLCDSPQS
ncbi:MAG: hypothetical protein NT090_05295 [Acidobacteria bacterium]|nr:hypothetical protein [Acidobacteriota bacterium]